MNLSKARATADRMPIWLQQSLDRLVQTLAVILGWQLDSVANIAALSAVIDTDIPNESVKRVQSVRDTFVLDKTDNVSVIDGITIVATASGTGRWHRQNIADESWRFQPNWYIDAVNGDDENSGETGALALKTYAEFWRRTNKMTVPQGDTTVTILTDLPVTDPINVDVTMSNSSQLFIVGAPTEVATGTVTTYDADGSAAVAPYPARLTSAGVDFAGMEGTLVEWVDAEGAGVSTYSWLLQDQGGGPGGQCWVTIPQGFAYSYDAVPAPASSYRLLSIPTVYIGNVKVRGSGYDEDTSITESGIVSIRFLRAENGLGNAGNQDYPKFSGYGPVFNLSSCKCCSLRSMDARDWEFTCCWIDSGCYSGGVIGWTAGVTDGWYHWGGFCYCTNVISAGLSIGNGCQFYNCDVLFQGPFGTITGPGGYNFYTYFSGVRAWQFSGIFYGDLSAGGPNDIVSIDGGTELHLSLSYDGSPNLVGGSSNVWWLDGRRLPTDFAPYRNPHTGDAILDWGGYAGLSADGYADGGQSDVLHAGVVGALSAGPGTVYAHTNLLENANIIGFVITNRCIARALQIDLETAPDGTNEVTVQVWRKALSGGGWGVIPALTLVLTGAETHAQTSGTAAQTLQPGDLIAFSVTPTDNNPPAFAAADLSISLELS